MNNCGNGIRRILSIRKSNTAASLEDAQKRKDAPVPENKVVSLEERAKDEQKPFLEQLLREGARKLLQAAIENAGTLPSVRQQVSLLSSGRTLSGKLSLILIAVFVVTVVVTVFPVAVVMVMSFAPIPLTVSPYVTVVLVPFAVVSARFAPIPLTVSPYVTVVLIPFAVVSARFAPIPLPIVPYITMVLIPFAVVPARYGNDDLLP
jgi:hypothetical protein